MNLTILLIVVGQLFAITDAIGNLPIFYSITKDLDKKERHEAFLTAAIFSFALLIIFMFLGNFILTLFGIQMSDFKIAGGLLILVIAIIILVRGSLFQAKEKIEVGVVPLVMSSHSSLNRFTSHSPLNPGRRCLPVRSCCMAAFLTACFLAISLSNAWIRLSTSDKALAMTRCSAGRGKLTE